MMKCFGFLLIAFFVVRCGVQMNETLEENENLYTGARTETLNPFGKTEQWSSQPFQFSGPQQVFQVSEDRQLESEKSLPEKNVKHSRSTLAHRIIDFKVLFYDPAGDPTRDFDSARTMRVIVIKPKESITFFVSGNPQLPTAQKKIPGYRSKTPFPKKFFSEHRSLFEAQYNCLDKHCQKISFHFSIDQDQHKNAVDQPYTASVAYHRTPAHLKLTLPKQDVPTKDELTEEIHKSQWVAGEPLFPAIKTAFAVIGGRSKAFLELPWPNRSPLANGINGLSSSSMILAENGQLEINVEGIQFGSVLSGKSSQVENSKTGNLLSIDIPRFTDTRSFPDELTRNSNGEFREGLVHVDLPNYVTQSLVLNGNDRNGNFILDLAMKTAASFALTNRDTSKTSVPLKNELRFRLTVYPLTDANIKILKKQKERDDFISNIATLYHSSGHNSLLAQTGINPKTALLRHFRPNNISDHYAIQRMLKIEKQMDYYTDHPEVQKILFPKDPSKKGDLKAICSQYIPVMAPIRRIVRNSYMQLKVSPSLANVMFIESQYSKSGQTNPDTQIFEGTYNNQQFAQSTSATGPFQLLTDASDEAAVNYFKRERLWTDTLEKFYLFKSSPEKCSANQLENQTKCFASNEPDDRLPLEPSALLSAAHFRFIYEFHFEDDSPLLVYGYHDGQGTVENGIGKYGRNRNYPMTLELLHDFFGFQSPYGGDKYIFRFLATRAATSQPEKYCRAYGYEDANAIAAFYESAQNRLSQNEMKLFRDSGPLLEVNRAVYKDARSRSK